MESPSEVKILFWLGTLMMLFLAFGLLSLVMYYQKQFLKSKQLESERLLKAILESEKRNVNVLHKIYMMVYRVI